jgi:hypothetical protein
MDSSQAHHVYNHPDRAAIYYTFIRKDFIFDRYLAVYTASSRIFYVKTHLAFLWGVESALLSFYYSHKNQTTSATNRPLHT